MRFLATALGVLNLGLLASSPAHAESQTSQQPKFRTEIQAAAEGGANFTVTNLPRKTLTAGTFQFFLSSERRPQGAMDWDPLVQGRGEPGRETSGATRTGSKPDTVSPS
jgi:hypothetical protein